MLIALQASPEGPLLPWWVLYLALLGITYATWKMARRRWWSGCLVALAGWVVMFVAAAVTLPSNRVGLITLVTLLPPATWLAAVVSRALAGGERKAGEVRLPWLNPGVLLGQPNARSVLRSGLMKARYAAGMPPGPRFLARVRYLSGLEALQPRNVDLFAAGGQLWVAPLGEDTPPQTIALQHLLRADVVPEPEGPPTLRLSWSPPAGEYTRELVLAADAELPAERVPDQLAAISSLIGALMAADAEERRAEPVAHATAQARVCSSCGSTLPPGAAACPGCGVPV
jgi:hypothetical protein